MLNFQEQRQIEYVKKIVMGVTRFKGTIDGNEIDNCNVLIAAPLNDSAGNAQGFGIAKVAFGDSSNFERFNGLNFPCDMEVAFQTVTNASGKQKEILKSVLTDISNIRKETKLLEAKIEEVKKEKNLEKQTDFAKEFLVEGLENLRVPCDNLEKIVDNEIWTLPTYTDLLFKL